MFKYRKVESDEFFVKRVIPLRQLIDKYISWTLSKCKGDKDVAAARLKISKKTIYNRIKDGTVQDTQRRR